MNLPRSLSLGLAFLLAHAAATGHAGPQPPSLPFRVNADGSVNQRDLIKLTRRPPATDRITDVKLEVIKNANQIEYGRGFRPTGKAEMPPRSDLYANSLLLSDGTNHTLLPKKSVVFVPPFLEKHIVEERIGELIIWPEFLKRNRSWLQTIEISFATARGDDPLPEEKLKVIQQWKSIVVSIHKGGPISMRPPSKAPGTMEAEAAAGSTAKSGPAKTSSTARSSALARLK